MQGKRKTRHTVCFIFTSFTGGEPQRKQKIFIHPIISTTTASSVRDGASATARLIRWTKIDKRRRSGEALATILEDMKVLK